MKKEDFKSLLDKYLRGNATEEELVLLKRFESHFLDHSTNSIFEDASEKRQVRNSILRNVNRKIRPKKDPGLLKIAASIILLLTLGIGGGSD